MALTAAHAGFAYSTTATLTTNFYANAGDVLLFFFGGIDISSPYTTPQVSSVSYGAETPVKIEERLATTCGNQVYALRTAYSGFRTMTAVINSVYGEKYKYVSIERVTGVIADGWLGAHSNSYMSTRTPSISVACESAASIVVGQLVCESLDNVIDGGSVLLWSTFTSWGGSFGVDGRTIYQPSAGNPTSLPWSLNPAYGTQQCFMTALEIKEGEDFVPFGCTF